MKKIAFLTVFFLCMLTAVCHGADTPGMTVYDTEHHGIYLTVGGTKVPFREDRLPFIDENGRTLIAVRDFADFMGMRLDWNDSSRTVTLTETSVQSEMTVGNSYTFAIGGTICYRNGEPFSMGTDPQLINGYTYVPIRPLSYMMKYNMRYTTDDRFEDIIITKTQGIQGFAKENSVTLWGNIESRFHENDGLGSMMPYEGERPNFTQNIFNAYELTFEGDSPKTLTIYWNTLYNEAYAEEAGVLYTIPTEFARFLQSFLDNGGDISYMVDREARELFAGYGWTIDYTISSHEGILPPLGELGAFEPAVYYYTYHNELSRDIGLDMAGYADEQVTIDIYRLHESMPVAFYPIQGARGIAVKHEGKIIGAYISAGRHQVENACSLSGKPFHEITGVYFETYISSHLKAEEHIVTDEPEEIIRRYFAALAEGDTDTMTACTAKYSAFFNLTTNLLASELYNTPYVPMFGNKGITAVSNLVIEPEVTYEDWDEAGKRVAFPVRFEVLREGEATPESQYWLCWLVYESERTGWKISGFGH